MKVTAHKQGAPSWFELSTTDQTSALEFYRELFGWQDDPQPVPEGEPYHIQRKDEDSVAAISGQMPDEAAQGIPPHWSVYLAVDDLDAVAGKVEGAGGQVIAPPFDVMDVGRMAVISDPTGGVVCLWQAGTNIGAGSVDEAGAPSWAELVTTDPAKAAAFYESVLGVEVAAGAQPPGAPPYTLLKVGGEDVAGVMQITPEMAQMPTVWTAYFGVDDLDASAAQVQSLGGQVMVPPTDIPEGRFAVAADRQQAIFGLYEAKEA
jgi:predicted enzyme related to lactoylglutathione lyase